MGNIGIQKVHRTNHEASLNANFQKISISNLSACPQWLSDVAQWSHQEWRKGRQTRVSDGQDQKFALERRRHLEKHLAGSSLPATFVAHTDSRPLGSASVVYFGFQQKAKASEWLTNVYVLPEYRGQGIAERLINRALDLARKEGIKEIKLYTRDQVDYYLKRQWKVLSQSRIQGQQVQVLVRRL